MLVTKDELIESVLEDVNFINIHKCMTVVDWKWNDEPYSPTREQLRDFAKELLNDALKSAENNESKSGMVSCGGFTASAEIMEHDTTLCLSFTLEEAESTEELIKD